MPDTEPVGPAVAVGKIVEFDANGERERRTTSGAECQRNVYIWLDAGRAVQLRPFLATEIRENFCGMQSRLQWLFDLLLPL